MRLRSTCLLLLGITSVSPALTGCSGSSRPTVVRARDHVASAVHVALNHYGVPVQTGVIGCEAPAPDGAIHCQATTAYTPQAEVDAVFRAPGGIGSASCPGTLHITVGGAPLATVAEDPCR